MTHDSPAARSVLLRRLPRDGFVPPDGAAPWAGGAYAAEVEAFAAAYWELAPRERRARWADLRARGTGPLDARLAELEAGLDVTPPLQADRYAAEVSRAVCELFTLPPRERAARRRAWLAGLAEPLGLWAVAARDFAKADPAAARLDPLLLHRLRDGLVPAPVAPLDPGAVGSDVLAGLLWDEQRHARERRAARRKKTDRWIVAAIVAVVGPFVLLVGNGIARMPRVPRGNPAPPAPAVTVPPSFPPPRPGISAAEVEEIVRRARASTRPTAFRDASGRVWPLPRDGAPWSPFTAIPTRR